MILIDNDFWLSIGVILSDGNAGGSQYDFYNAIEMSNAVDVYDRYGFFKNSPINSVYYDNALDWYQAIGVFHSEPIYDEYTFMQNVTFDGVNAVGTQFDFYQGLLDVIETFTISSSFLLDGVNEYFTCDDALTPLATSTVGTWSILIKPTDATPASGDTMISFGDTDANSYLMLYMNATGTARALTSIGGVLQWDLDTDSVEFADGVWAFVTLVKTATSSVIYINGVAPSQTFDVSTDKTVWFNDIAGLDNGRIGSLDFNSGGNVNHQNGNISHVSFLDTDLSAAQVLDYYNSGKPKNPNTEFPTNCKYFFNPDNSGSTAEFTVTDSVNSITATSVNLEDVDKTTTTPY